MKIINTAECFGEITVIDPDSKGKVELSIFKHENGGIFAIDNSFIDQVLDNILIIADPFNEKMKVMLNNL